MSAYDAGDRPLRVDYVNYEPQANNQKVSGFSRMVRALNYLLGFQVRVFLFALSYTFPSITVAQLAHLVDFIELI